MPDPTPTLTHPDAKRIDEILTDCFFRPEELDSVNQPLDESTAIYVDGIQTDFGFHKGRIEKHKAEILRNVDACKFNIGPTSFLKLCAGVDDFLWGEHVNVEQLMALGIAAGVVQEAYPKEMRAFLPGEVPYYARVVSDEDEEPPVVRKAEGVPPMNAKMDPLEIVVGRHLVIRVQAPTSDEFLYAVVHVTEGFIRGVRERRDSYEIMRTLHAELREIYFRDKAVRLYLTPPLCVKNNEDDFESNGWITSDDLLFDTQRAQVEIGIGRVQYNRTGLMWIFHTEEYDGETLMSNEVPFLAFDFPQDKVYQFPPDND